MRALSIRQPFAELILRGIKTVEYRSRPTSIVGERFYVYASKKSGDFGELSRAVKSLALGGDKKVWSNDLALPGDRLPGWMIELAAQIRMVEADALLPTGVIVGSAVIDRVVEGGDGFYHWHLTDVERLAHPRKPRGHPQPVWFQSGSGSELKSLRDQKRKGSTKWSSLLRSLRQWRRGELNPRPKTTPEMASTCLVHLLISIRWARTNTLPPTPAVSFSSARPTAERAKPASMYDPPRRGDLADTSRLN